jgi:hypothetical protein
MVTASAKRRHVGADRTSGRETRIVHRSKIDVKPEDVYVFRRRLCGRQECRREVSLIFILLFLAIPAGGSTMISDKQVEQAAVASSETMYRTIYTSAKEAKAMITRQTILVNVRLDASRVLPGNETFNPPRSR